MKSRILILVAVLGLVGSGVAFAQDGGLGKKGNGGKSGGNTTGGGKGNSGGTTGGVKSDPPPRQNGGNTGGSRGNQNNDNIGRGNSGGNGGRGNSGTGSVAPPVRSGGSSGTGSVAPPVRSGGSSGSILGRPNRQGQTEDNTFGKRGGDSRSGRVGYNGAHNGNTQARGNPIVIADVPSVTSNRRITHEGVRENRVTQADSRYRNGYYHYDQNFRDNDFWYPHYGFQWYSGCNYVTSPFYYYSHLPAYIDCVRVSIGSLTWINCDTRYSWSAPRYDRYGYQSDRYGDFDYAVGDIERAFEDRSIRFLAHMVPTRGRVEIDMGRGNEYTLDAGDFYDLMRDLVEGTRTTSYRVTNVYRDGNRGTVEAVHEFSDTWGQTERVRHTFGLRQGQRGYEISFFRSDR